jgi:hypothetical protein
MAAAPMPPNIYDSWIKHQTLNESAALSAFCVRRWAAFKARVFGMFIEFLSFSRY